MIQFDELGRLLDIAPPPAHPIDGGRSAEDWEGVESALSSVLPSDYKYIINLYGSGDFVEVLYVLNPFCLQPELNLMAQIGPEPEAFGSMLESYTRAKFGPFSANCPFEIYPHPGGIMPLASESTGKDLFWITLGKPEEWTIVRYDWRGGAAYERFDHGLSGFLIRWLDSELASYLDGSDTTGRFSPVFCPLGRVRELREG